MVHQDREAPARPQVSGQDPRALLQPLTAGLEKLCAPLGLSFLLPTRGLSSKRMLVKYSIGSGCVQLAYSRCSINNSSHHYSTPPLSLGGESPRHHLPSIKPSPDSALWVGWCNSGAQSHTSLGWEPSSATSLLLDLRQVTSLLEPLLLLCIMGFRQSGPQGGIEGAEAIRWRVSAQRPYTEPGMSLRGHHDQGFLLSRMPAGPRPPLPMPSLAAGQ